eukprot:TRINITY_DN4201_c0_g1_i1.p1 TRINITY_DN4201_c0_g1~~TRINITY_DN4201_c0_g1_i1.p1  ORF type:complete len:194 (-),score=29.92 TRINITY_DN4201_c0_g1_i1:99-680(-)
MNGMLESESNEIVIEDCDVEMFKLVLNWIYTDFLVWPASWLEIEKVDDILASKFWELWQIASYFCLDGLVDIVENYIITNLVTKENICSFWNGVSKLTDSRLYQMCKAYFLKNIADIYLTSNYLTLEKSIIMDVFSNDKNNTFEKHDITIFNNLLRCKTIALTRWVAAHQPVRLKRKWEDNQIAESTKRRRIR